MARDGTRLGRGLDSLIRLTTPPQESDRDDQSGSSANQPASERTSTVSVGQSVVSDRPTVHIPIVASTGDESHLESTPSSTPSPQPATQGDETAAAAVHVSLDAIAMPKNQPRTVFPTESLQALARSISQSGVVQPLIVRPITGMPPTDTQHSVKYELVAGERRYRAAKAAGLTRVPAIVRDIDDRSAVEIALVENIQREDLNAIDRANAYARYAGQFNLSTEQMAARLGEDRSTIANYLRLLELPQEVKDMVASKSLSMGHARCLLGVSTADGRVDLARATLAQGLSVRALEELVRRRRGDSAGDSGRDSRGRGQSAGSGDKPAHVRDLESRFQGALGTRVTIKVGRKKGSGRILIEYYSLDDFDRISERLGVNIE